MRYQRNLNKISYHSVVLCICINKDFCFRSPFKGLKNLKRIANDTATVCACEKWPLYNRLKNCYAITISLATPVDNAKENFFKNIKREEDDINAYY